jgi:predicted RNA-binding protein with PIN domain
MTPLYLVDGFNLLHAVVLRGRRHGDWRRREEQARVVALVEGFEGAEVWVIFDVRESAKAAAAGELERCSGTERVQVRFAPSADDCIVELCAEYRGLREVVVVSADRALVDRARHRGAQRLSPWQFAEQCGPTRSLAG